MVARYQDEEDLMQHPERLNWYEAKFCADDMPDWNVGRFVSSSDVAPGMRCVVMDVEISRERVPLRNAYKAAGQRACVRVNSGVEYQLTVSSAPFPVSLNKAALLRVRGDLIANATKTVVEQTSVYARLHCLVSKEEAPDVYNMDITDMLEVGPFVGSGVDMRAGGLMSVYRYPTIVMFVAGSGIATARALLTATADVPNLSPGLRKDVRVYYKVPNQASAVFVDELRAWGERLESGSRATFGIYPSSNPFWEAFDDDQTLTYDPETTAALVLTGGDTEEEAAALEACKEADITTVVTDSLEQASPVYWASTPQGYMNWRPPPAIIDQEDEDQEDLQGQVKAEA